MVRAVFLAFLLLVFFPNTPKTLAGQNVNEPACPFLKDIWLGHPGRYSPDGCIIAKIKAENAIELWDAQTGKLIRTTDATLKSPLILAFSPDSQYVLYGNENQASLWDLKTGDIAQTLSGHTGAVLSGAFSPDGKWIVTGAADNSARVWESSTGKTLAQSSKYASPVVSIAFTPDGKSVVAADGKNIRLWNPQSGATSRVFKAHTDLVNNIATSPDGKWIASTGDDSTVRLWEPKTGRLAATLSQNFGQYASALKTVVFASNSRSFLTGGGAAIIWDVQTQRTVKLYPFPFLSLYTDYSPDGQFILLRGFNDRQVEVDSLEGCGCIH